MTRFVRRTMALASKEVRHILRDPRSLFIALMMPAVMLLLFGFGVSFDLRDLPVMVVDQDRSASSRALGQRFFSSSEFVRVEAPSKAANLADGEHALKAGRAVAVLVIPHDFEADLRRGRAVDLQLLIDGADNNTAVQAQAKAESAVLFLARSIGAGSVGSSAGAQAPPAFEVRTLTRFNPEAKSAINLVPGIAAYVLAMVAVLMTALTVAREWERGSMAQLFATPVGRLEIVLGKLLPYLVLGMLGVLLVLVVGSFVFEVPVRGSVAALAVVSVLFVAGMLGQGLLISVVTRDQMVATQGATMSSMLPAMLLSGFVFPVENMPAVLRLVSRFVPARYFIQALRGILLKGNGFAELWAELLALTLFALLMVVMSTARFRRTLA